MSNSTNSGPNVGQSCRQCWQDSSVQEDLRVSLSLLPLGNHGLLSSSDWSSEHGESMIGQGVGGVSDVREDWRVVDERSGGGDHSAASSKDGGIGISRPLAITVTIRVTIISSVTSVSVSSVSIITIV